AFLEEKIGLDNRKGIDFAFIGPEQPLAAGIVNFLEDVLDIKCVGSRKDVALIESSKIFARKLLVEYQIDANPSFSICHTKEEVESFLNSFPEVAVKPDVLTGGKGVKVSGDQLHSREEVISYALERINLDGSVLLEEKLEGEEFTLQAFCDGKTLQTMPLVQDFKRAYDGDKGPNTGSMGSYSCVDHKLPFLGPEMIEQAEKIMQQTIEAIHHKTGAFYKGILYGQFMLKDGKPLLVEYNVRFGDPEAINVMELLNTNLVELSEQIIEGKLAEVHFEKPATVCVYLVPSGYPENPIKGSEILLDGDLASTEVFYAAVYEEEGKVKTTGSRAIALISKGETVEKAREKVYQVLEKKAVTGDLFYRKDIALRKN
ncbi:MAG: phosphoribosylamine--glycine ligase, partial [Candidatus Heimdallarchaeota archaeon]|nr:phosphoribosylamine--glycine ligase [Candidatus Heimdallarchaeota archaeon]MCK5049912.1 phosphoribosylamine--glycine ligase [Candidatus Heimdallarchaeota archaeon]